MTKQVMYILSGMSFAGKSVLAREIQKVTGYELVDPDEISREWGLGLKGEFISEKDWYNIHIEAEKRAVKILNDGKSLIYDTTALIKSERNKLRKIALACKAMPVVIIVNIDRKEAYKRWQENNESEERHTVHINDFKMCADGFKFPEDDEEFIVYSSGNNLDKWIEENIDN